MTSEYVPAKVSDEEYGYVDLKQKRLGEHNKRRRRDHGGESTFFTVKILVSKWYKEVGDSTRQHMRKRCGQSKDVKAKPPVDGTCRA